MKTTKYNPSALEIELANIFKNLQKSIEAELSSNKIEAIELNGHKDNPDLLLKLIDNDGDRHEVVVKFIQRADKGLF